MTGQRSDAALASILLTTRLLRRDPQPLSPTEFWDLIESCADPAELLGLSAKEMQDRTHRTPEEATRLVQLLNGATALALELEQLGQSGLRVVSVFDDDYPVRLRERLGTATPPLLYVAGPIDVLQTDGIGIVGSRNVGSDAREVAADVARAAVRAGLAVVSGVARGIDQVAMSAALEVEGRVAGIPVDSMSKLVRDQNIRRAITNDQLCLASPYIPSAGFSVGNAMGRNKLVYALSQVTLVVTADHGTGGTWAGAVEALEKKYGPVAVWRGEGAGPGNEKLSARGAIEISDPASVLEIHRTEKPRSEQPAQLRIQL